MSLVGRQIAVTESTGDFSVVFIVSHIMSGRVLLVYASGEDKRVRVWDIGSGNLYGEYKSHTDTVHSLTFNKHSSVLFSGSCCTDDSR